jgi:hypothetical protein
MSSLGKAIFNCLVGKKRKEKNELGNRTCPFIYKFIQPIYVRSSARHCIYTGDYNTHSPCL